MKRSYATPTEHDTAFPLPFRDAGAGRRALLATVVRTLPNAQFLVRLEPTGEAAVRTGRPGREVTVHLAGPMRVRAVRLLAGDEVRIELSPFDPTKGRIVATGSMFR